MSYLEVTITIYEDFEYDFEGTGLKEAIYGYF